MAQGLCSHAVNRALLIKELRALRPCALCIFAIFAIGVAYSLATEAPDNQRFEAANWLIKSRGGSFVLLALFGLIAGAGLLVQESEQRTLLFLDGLPLSRSRVFTMKALAGLLVIALVPLLDVGSDIFFDSLSRTSVAAPFPWTFRLVVVGLELIAGAYLLALAMLISFTRAWFALVSGLVFWTYLWLRQRGWEWLVYLDPYELLAPALDGSRVLIPWRHLAVHAGATAGFLGGAWLAFLSLGDRAQYAADRLGRLRWLGALGVGVRWLAPVVWIAALVRLSGTTANDSRGGEDSPVGEEAFSRRESKHYEFLFRTAQLAAAKPLIAAADAIYDKVTGFLGASPAPTRIVVDLASTVAKHAAGQTNWTKIGMPLQGDPALSELRKILGHETTHVFIEQLSEGRLASHFNEIRFLHEGLATHLELSLFGSDADRAMNRREIAGAWSRGKVPLELLADDSALGRKREPYLVYPLGSVFARVLIETQGQDAPARLLRAFARKDAPRGLSGMALWRDTMQAANLSLDRVSASYDVACAVAMEQEKAFVAMLPRLTAAVRIVQEEIVVQPKFDGEAPGAIVCYTETDDPFLPQLEALARQKDGTFSWPLERQSKPAFRYLLGWRTGQTRMPVFEPWAETIPAK